MWTEKIFILEAEEVRDTQEKTLVMTLLSTGLSFFQALTSAFGPAILPVKDRKLSIGKLQERVATALHRNKHK